MTAAGPTSNQSLISFHSSLVGIAAPETNRFVTQSLTALLQCPETYRCTFDLTMVLLSSS
jgi:hypothetical protein